MQQIGRENKPNLKTDVDINYSPCRKTPKLTKQKDSERDDLALEYLCLLVKEEWVHNISIIRRSSVNTVEMMHVSPQLDYSL